ncbi:MAG: DUF2306 domain-containing protein [Bacteroidetes bacterium]|nr:DUF2306 domain-containing protein [Bacteroidota bacterium]
MGNRRSITLRKTFRYSYRLLFWIPVVFFSLLLVKNTIPYFSFSPGFSFIQERAILFAKPIYKASFYIHIFAGMFCIATALLQFSSELLRKRKLIHVISGRIYVFVVLGLGAPTGLYMSFFAKGSYWERALFVFMALYWFYTTIKGLQAVLRKEILMHKIWMIRSYSMAMTAATFRIYHLLFYSIGWGHLENYEISLWISVLGNILFAECYIYNKNQSYFKSINLLIQKR